MARPRSTARGFTLVELLVALFVLSLVAVLSWRGLDGMVRTQSQTQARSDEVLAAQVALAQWKTDLDALVQLPQLDALDWDGRVLRLTRRNPADPGEGVRVTAWTQRNVNGGGTWLRWQSPPLRTRGEVQEAWARAGAWAENAGDAERAREVPVLPLSEWQLYFHRGGAWVNPQSREAARVDPATAAAAAAQPGARAQPPLPDGVRLVLVLPPGHPLAGQLSLDWASPRLAGGRSS